MEDAKQMPALDFFEFKYLEEIHEVFNDLKALNGHYNTGLFSDNIFSEKGNAGALSDFIFSIVSIAEPYNDNGDSDEEL